jgi:K+-sensing histidine kinase KdpD
MAVNRVLVCMPPTRDAREELEAGARLAHDLGGVLFAACVMTRREDSGEPAPGADDAILAGNAACAESLGATLVRVTAHDVAEGLVALADREGITHAVFGEGGRPVKLFDAETIIGALVSRTRVIEVLVVARQPSEASSSRRALARG